MKKIFRLLAATLIIGVSMLSCEKDDFTEKDALDGQEELERLRDSLQRVGGIVNYTVNVINAGNAGFMKNPKANGLNGVTVTTSQLGVVSTKQTNDQGMVVFGDLRVGKVTVNISFQNYTSVSFVAELTPENVQPISSNTVRSAATQIPLFPLTGATTTTVSGLVTYETDLTNDTPELAAGIPVAATIDVNNTFMDTYIRTAGYDGTGQIIKLAYGEAVVAGTTNAEGKYSLTVPTTASGLPIRINIADLAVDQQLLQSTLYKKDVFGVQTIRTLFSQNTANTPSFIPTVRPAYVTFSAPTGTTVGAEPTTAAAAVAVLSKGEVESINITNAGEGYTQTPVVKITGNGVGATATATLTNGRVTGITVTNKGQNYTTASVSLTETGGENATATAVLASKVKSFTVTNGGSNYTTAPTVTIAGNGTGATAEAKMNGYISKLILTNGGAGYTKVPTVTIAGGGGINATADAVLSTGNLRSITVPSNADRWFTAVPTVSFASPGGTEAPTATCDLKTVGRINSIPVSTNGAGYTTPPAVTITGGGGSGAVAVAILGPTGAVASISVINKGSGYTSEPTVTIAAPPVGGTQAVAGTVVLEKQVNTVTITNPGAGFVYGSGADFDGTDVLFNGTSITGTEIKLNRAVVALSITDSGNDFTSVPTITITGDNTTSATATAEIKYSVQNIVVTNPGSGYTTASVSFAGDGSGAAATVTLGDAYVANVILTNTGSGYTAVPYVTVSGGGSPSENAVIIPVLTDDKITGFTIDKPGKGYGSTPTLTVVTYKTAAAANANLNSGTIAAINVTNPGQGYTVAPIVEFVGTSGTGATATAVLDAQGRVQRIDVTNGGSGYVSAPTVNLVVPNTNLTAKGTVTVNEAGVVTAVNVVDGGNGYIVAPTVTITPSVPGLGVNATAIAKISGGKVSSVVVTNGGTGYKGKNTPGNYFPSDPATVAGKAYLYSQPTGATLNMKSGTPIINDIYLGTGLRTVTE